MDSNLYLRNKQRKKEYIMHTGLIYVMNKQRRKEHSMYTGLIFLIKYQKRQDHCMSQPINCIHSRGMDKERRKEHSMYTVLMWMQLVLITCISSQSFLHCVLLCSFMKYNNPMYIVSIKPPSHLQGTQHVHWVNLIF